MELLRLRKERNKLLAKTEFRQFLCYVNPKYEMEWFHRIIADHCQMLYEGKIKNLMIFVPPQHGKELSDDTLVPTPQGFVRHGDLKCGDYVFNAEGKPVKVLAVSEKVQSEYVVTFSDGEKVECHGNHEWVVLDRSYRKQRTLETRYIATQKLYSGIEGKRGCHYRFQIASNVCVDFQPQQTPIPPYVLGAWLGDGLYESGLMHIGNGDTEIIQKISQYYNVHENLGSQSTQRFRLEGLTKHLHEAGVFGDKHIPDSFIYNSVEARKELIAGLIDTDGYVYQKNGRVTISNANKRIIDNAALILRSLGQMPTICEYAPRLSSGGVQGKLTVYQLCFNPTMDFPTVVPRKRIMRTITNRRRTIVRIERKEGLGIGNCIQVEGGVYLVGEHFIPTHNSEIVSRNFPAWAFGKNPDLKIVGCSYSADLAEQFSRSIQRTVDSSEYHEIFPDSYLNGSNVRTMVRGYLRNINVFEFVNHRGYYKAVGVGGGLTGTAVDIAIIDDPVKDAIEAYSDTYRARVWDWYNSVLTTRLHNNSKQLFIMTRWHEDDLAGRILKTEGDNWTVLRIPAICEEDGDGELHSHRHVGDALWPERHSIEKLDKYRQRAPKEFNALYQQRPTIEGGNIVKRDWFLKISYLDFWAMHFNEPIHFYLDTAYDKKSKKKGVDNDPSGILAACRIKNNIYLVNGAKVYKEMPDLLKFLPQYMADNGGSDESRLCIEPKANGKSVAQMLKTITTLNVRYTETPTDSKEVRLRAVSPKVECGRVYIVEGPWNEDFLDEVCGFPTQPHDEYVDILGYAINDLYEDDDDFDYDGFNWR